MPRHSLPSERASQPTAGAHGERSCLAPHADHILTRIVRNRQTIRANHERVKAETLRLAGRLRATLARCTKRQKREQALAPWPEPLPVAYDQP